MRHPMDFKAISKHAPIIIFGAAIQGEVILRLLELCRLSPVCFIDNDLKKQAKRFYDYEVLNIVDAYTLFPNAAVIIAAEWHYAEMRRLAEDIGFKHIVNDTDILEAIDFENLLQEEILPISWKLAQRGYLHLVRKLPTDFLYLARLNLVVTTRCSLNCARCTSLMQYYTKPETFSTQFILDEMKGILSAVDLIGRMEVLGGEPFLHKELPDIIAEIVRSKQVFQIDIVTNGTILPSKKYLKGLRYNNVRVIVNDYSALSSKKDELLFELQALGVNGLEHRHWKWAEVGEFESRNRSNEELTKLFGDCGSSSCTEVLNGKLYRCSRSSHGTHLGLIPNDPDDYVDILARTGVRENIRKLFQRPFVTACNYCDGNIEETLILTPAEQKG
jgi:uncharacterized radical SAM superfamily Fe-S cluster-containing enzyme